MQALLVVLFMMVIGAVIGGVTNMIAVKMLFHPFKAYYIFGRRVPFTPGLIPKRRGEIAVKIGQVVEDHLLTESLIREKLNAPEMRQTIRQTVANQVARLQQDDMTIQRLAEHFDIDVVNTSNQWIDQFVSDKLQVKYEQHRNHTLEQIAPKEIISVLDQKVSELDGVLLEKARTYLESDKGYADICEMLDTFFIEKGGIVSMLQMFMTTDAMAERIQKELIRLTNHHRAQNILAAQIQQEYTKFKQMQIETLVTHENFEQIRGRVADYVLMQLKLSQRAHQPLNRLVPQLFERLDVNGIDKITDLILSVLANRLSSIMRQVNIRGLIEEQINRFELDYIEQLIFEIANKELKLIMLLGFILGGLIGIFQGVIAIFV
ncbi:membrane protein [Staphylococcus microti]|uniref:Membrane protein n=1 Tax=Staphylococcus microti TaxID=569857 RepID=A0A0D6XS47_9STAP|nr:DUF445 family protein [Staphylococcus microti]KIX91412.1 membrane protein [Staphylococcus microti]PNZ81248.1 DUF445 domain-containing protein [Staphylococcus microti]SUM57848.1 membrane protein [Staphylococcus microti]